MSNNYITLVCTICSGRGIAKGHIASSLDELEALIGCRVFPGTLNLISDRPIRLEEEQGRPFFNGRKMVWPAELAGIRVWICRTATAPLHGFELISEQRLRDHPEIRNRGSVEIRFSEEILGDVGALGRIVWHVLWWGRSRWIYTSNVYYRATKRLAIALGATQSNGLRSGFEFR